jgi:hypothetical protein
VSIEPALLAVSDLHVDFEENRSVVDLLRPRSERDWLIVAGDVAHSLTDFAWALTTLRERFERVIWTPGNHELFAVPRGEAGVLCGERRYTHLIECCRRLGVATPEDDFLVWEGAGGPILIAPLFVLYDYTFGRSLAPTPAQALRRAYDAGIVCADEFLLAPDPYPSREAWCHARVQSTERSLAASGADLPMRHPELAQWCGTLRTADWHRRFPVVAVVYGHLHIPWTSWHDRVSFDEVSLGYPRERCGRERGFEPRQIFPRRAP